MADDEFLDMFDNLKVDKSVITKGDISKIVKVLKIKDKSVIKTLNASVGKKAKDKKRLKYDIAGMLAIETLLTDDQINEILSGIRDVPSTLKCVSEFNTKELKKGLYSQLMLKKIVPSRENIKKLKQYITDSFYNSIIPAGESVGLNSAMAIGQPLTQMGLNTFHQAGSSNNLASTIGSVQDLFGARRNKETVAHFNDKGINYIDAWREMKKIRDVNLKYLVSNTQLMTRRNECDRWWTEIYAKMNGIDINSLDGKFLRLKMSKERCHEMDIYFPEIAPKITEGETNPVIVVHSPFNIGYIDIYPVYNQISLDMETTLSQEDKIDLYLSYFLPTVIEKLNIRGVEGVESYALKNLNTTAAINESKFDDKNVIGDLSKSDKRQFWILSMKPEISLFEGVPEDILVKLFTSCGVKLNYIEKGDYFLATSKEMEVEIVKEGQTVKEIRTVSPLTYVRSKIMDATFDVSELLQEAVKEGEDYYAIDNEVYKYGYIVSARIFGEKIIDELITYDLFDKTRVYPNNVVEMAESFGIDAARLFLSVSYSKYLDINTLNNHIIADYQTSLGMPVALNYTGSSKHNTSTLQKVAFQDPYSSLHSAAAMGVKDKVVGFSESIMTGKKVRNGTGIVKIKFDVKDLGEKTVYEKQEIEGDMVDVEYAEDDTQAREKETDDARDFVSQKFVIPTFMLVKFTEAPDILSKWLGTA